MEFVEDGKDTPVQAILEWLMENCDWSSFVKSLYHDFEKFGHLTRGQYDAAYKMYEKQGGPAL